jgi:hypothetical protein
MNKLSVTLLAAMCSLVLTAAAQDTNALRTQIGAFEARTGAIIVKGYAPVGSIAAGPIELSVRCKETTDIGTGQKFYGLAVELVAGGNNVPRDQILVDDDEVDALLDAINYIVKSNYEITTDKVTTLASYEASYTTKSGLRVLAHSVRKDGGVRYWLESSATPRFALSAVEMTQLYNLVDQARKNLDGLKAGK